jgi:hypothetical protein
VTRTPRWLTEATAWAAVLVLAAGLIGAWSIRGYDTRREIQAETPTVQTEREVRTTVPVPVRRYVPGRPSARVALVPALGPPPGPQYDAPPAQTAPPEQRFAFLAGITHYRAPTHETIGAANDVRFIAALLERNGWLPQNIRVVTDGAATGSAIRSGLAWLAARSTAGTYTLFHYSGHVKQYGDTENLWPVDHDLITDSDLGSILARGSGKLWVDIAGCEAGGFMDSLPGSRVLFSGSSRSDQKSYEYPQWGESVWTGLLFDLGTSQGGADADHDGRVTAGEALRYASYYANAITRGQQPYGPQTPQVAGDDVRGWTLADPPA